MFFDQFIKLCNKKGVAPTAALKEMGLTSAVLAKWREGAQPRASTVFKLAKYFNVPSSSLSEESNVEPVEIKKPQHKALQVPVLGRIPAGMPIEAVEEIEDYLEYYIPDHDENAYFALRIRGDSMAPRYDTGSVVIFRQQSCFESGQRCAVMINGMDATFKTVFRTVDGGIVLHSENDAYADMTYSKEQVEALPIRILGVAKETRRTE